MTRILLIGGCGYVGSRLYQALKARRYGVDTLDLEWRGNFVNPDNIRMDYGYAPASLLARYDVVLFMAGHSSVGQARTDPLGALDNNVTKLFALQQKLSPRQRFIYASSASVYNGVKGRVAVEGDEVAALAHNAYDISKTCFDRIMECYGESYAALRFGTVCGASPNLRADLVLNAMTLNALRHGKVAVSNPEAWRSLLGLYDLEGAVCAMVEGARFKAGCYNMASFSITIGELGKRVAGVMKAGLEYGADSPTYDYRISTEKLRAQFGVECSATVESLVQELVASQKQEKAARRAA